MDRALENTENTVYDLLKLLNVKFTERGIRELLKNHPNNPSLLSISDTLSRLRVENVSIKTTPDKLREIPTPFITVLKDGGNFIIVTSIVENIISYRKNNKVKSEHVEKFLQQWNETVLIAETSNQSGEKEFESNKRIEKINKLKIPALLIAGICLTVVKVQLQIHSVSQIVLFNYFLIAFIKLTGIFISCLLLWHDIDKANPFFRKICMSGNNKNCDAILNSNYSKIFGNLSWSEIGFFYFAGGYLFLIFGQLNSNELLLLTWFNFFAVPYTIFSIYYQWRIAKQWCVLCLMIQGLLLSEITVNFFATNSFRLTFSESGTIVFILSYSIPVVCWYLLKPLLKQGQIAKRHEAQLFYLKYDLQIFEALLLKQKRISENPVGLGILLGNSDAKHTLIKVCNPNCGPCAKAHPKMELLIKENKKINGRVLFTATTRENDTRALPVKHLMAITEANSKTLIDQALHNWYTVYQRRYELFADKYPIKQEILDQQNSKLDAMSDWCQVNGITATPTFFINGYQLPDIYSIEDLEYLLS